MPKSNTKKHNVPNSRDESLPIEIRSKIKDFKEMFPQYRQSTDLDILAIFDEFNNDYNAAVYGVANGLVQAKPSETWQTAGQKKKVKKSVRGKSVGIKNPRNDNTENRRAANSNRGQSASRGGRSRGGKSTQNSTRPIPTAPKDNTSTTSQSTTGNRPSPSGNSQKKQTSPPVPTQKTTEPPRMPTPKPSSTPVTEHLSYANAAKSRKPWSPLNPAKIESSTSAASSSKESGTGKLSAQVAAVAPVSSSKSVGKPSMSSIPPNVQSKPSTSLPSSSATSSVHTPMNSLPGSNVNPFGASTERTGVLLPGNFRSDDTMSFQFGNLGLVEEDPTSNTNSSDAAEKSKAAASKNKKLTDSAPPKAKVAPTPEVEVPGMVSGMPMGQYYPPMYQMDPSSMDPSQPRPMTYYPDAPYQQHYQARDAKYSRVSPNSPNYSSAAAPPRGEGGASATSKFNSESKGNAAQAQSASAQQQGTPYPYAPGHYPPMYGHPFVNSFPGGTYGNQPFYGFYKQPSFPGYQNFAGNQMGYAQGEGDQRAYYPNQDGSPGTGAPSVPSKAPNGQTSPSKSSQSPPGLEGSASQYNPDAFKNQASMDYYNQDPYMNSSFMSPQPFAYPPMSQQNYPLHPQQANVPSQQAGSSNSQNPTY